MLIIVGLVLFVVRPVINRITSGIEKKLDVLWPCYASQARQARCFHYDLNDKIIEMIESPFTMDSDWREILPICRYSDEWLIKTNPNWKKHAWKEDFVKGLMA